MSSEKVLTDEAELKASEEKREYAVTQGNALTRSNLMQLQAKMGEFYRLRGRLGTRAARRKVGLSQSDILTWKLVLARFEQEKAERGTASVGKKIIISRDGKEIGHVMGKLNIATSDESSQI